MRAGLGSKVLIDKQKILTALMPIAALVLAMVSIQTGAALALSLFPKIGAQGAVGLRVGLAALILLAIHRPDLRPTRTALAVILPYGLALGLMNLAFYMALRTVPLGVAVAVEFSGPLAVAALSQRGRWDLLWLGLATAGLLALAPWGRAGAAADPVGLLLALTAGLFWALYIAFGQMAARVGGGVTASGMTIAALVTVPAGLIHAGARLFDPALLPLGLVVAVLSSALPYSLEIYGLGRLPKATFSTLMSLEPAIGALSGALLLGQHLTLREDAAIAAIVAASLGAAATFAASRADDLPLSFGLD